MTPLVTGGLLAVFTLVLTLLGKGQFDSIRSEMSGQFQSVRSEIAGLRADMAVIKAELAAVRSDLTQVALALRDHTHPQTA